MGNPVPASPQARLERQQNALLELSRRWRLYEADFDKAISAIVETATEALALQRASVWFYNDARDGITCHDMYDARTRDHGARKQLRASDYPEYFEALHSEEVIAADDAHTDPRTAGFSESYLGPTGIGAMLDAPIRVGGRLAGVLCNEHVGGPRHFSADEQNTATYLANLVSLAYEFRQRERSEQDAARALSLLRAAFEACGAGILAVDSDREVTVFNQRLLDMWQVDAQAVATVEKHNRIRRVAAIARDPDALAARVEQIYADPECESVDSFELVDGRWIEVTSLPQRFDDEVVGRVWSFRDVTYQRSIEKDLRELAVRDPLTGLFNRRRAEETLESELQRAQRSKQKFSVAMLDIDHFKRVNDAHGHQAGDDVLRQLATDLRKRLRATDIACRWGGEEFLVILPHTDREGAVHIVDQLRTYLGRERKALPTFTVSAGVAEYDGGKRYDTTVATADARLYEAKELGRNRVC